MSDTEPRQTFIKSIRRPQAPEAQEPEGGESGGGNRMEHVSEHVRAARTSLRFPVRMVVGVVSGAVFGAVVGVLIYMYLLFRIGGGKKGMTASGCMIWMSIGASICIVFYVLLAMGDRKKKPKKRRR